MNLHQLLSTLPKHTVNPNIDTWPINITKITADSRQVAAGTLFVAYKGVSVDGHRYIDDAIEKGAVAIICEESFIDNSLQPTSLIPTILVPNGREALAYLSAAWCNFPAKQLTMIGLTGTDGKTTTTNFLYHILQAANKKTGMISTVNAVIGNSLHETGLHTTTPDAPDVQQFLVNMVQADTDICLLETTSHGLAQHRVTACDFDIAIVTNITHEHLDIHGSLAGYRAAKASLFESLATATNKGIPKTAILNCDDWSFGYLKDKLNLTNTAWLGYSLTNHPEATLTAHHINCQPDKTSFTVKGPHYNFAATTSLLGDYNISNCLAATAAAIEVLGITPEQAQQGIMALPGISGRMQRINQGQLFTAVVDFAHTPNSLRRALGTAQSLTSGRVIAIFGCAGLRDVEKRTTMGQVAAKLADYTIITAEDPRTESLTAIMSQTAQAMIEKGGVAGQTFECVADRGRAIYKAVQLAQPGDMVLALGKGHEQSMCFGNIEYPWNDTEAMRSALQGTPLLTLPTA